jgi:hypothetical protein
MTITCAAHIGRRKSPRRPCNLHRTAGESGDELGYHRVMAKPRSRKSATSTTSRKSTTARKARRTRSAVARAKTRPKKTRTVATARSKSKKATTRRTRRKAKPVAAE